MPMTAPAPSPGRHLDLADETATAALARALAPCLGPGDVVALWGALGSGKTAFARALVDALLTAPGGPGAEEVPSPTFTLVQTYEAPAGVVWHFDLYRLASPDEVAELGWDEARAGIALVEWPDRLGPWLPADRLDVALRFGATEAARLVTLTGHGSWVERLDRLDLGRARRQTRGAAPLPADADRGAVREAMVLAAGLGLRMRPLTLERPKPLIEVAGRPLLDHILDRLADAGVERAVVNTHYKGDMIAAHLADRSGRPRVEISHEDVLLDTGGAVKRALDRFASDPILVVNGDVLWLDGPVPALRRLAAAWDAAAMDALLLVMSNTKAFGFGDRGDYHLDPLGRLARRRGHGVAPFVYSGVQLITPRLYGDAPDGPFSNNLLWDRAEAAGRLYGLVHDGALFHVGTPAMLSEVNDMLSAPGRPWALP